MIGIAIGLFGIAFLCLFLLLHTMMKQLDEMESKLGSALGLLNEISCLSSTTYDEVKGRRKRW